MRHDLTSPFGIRDASTHGKCTALARYSDIWKERYCTGKLENIQQYPLSTPETAWKRSYGATGSSGQIPQ